MPEKDTPTIKDLREAVATAEKIAKRLVDHEDHQASPHIVPIRSRLKVALDSIDHHETWFAAQPKKEVKAEKAAPAPAPAAK